MAADWYYSKNGHEWGPIPASQLKNLAVKGALEPSDLVWQEGMAEWINAENVHGLFPPLIIITDNDLAYSQPSVPLVAPNRPRRGRQRLLTSEEAFHSAGGKYCSTCGEKIHHLAEICPACGVRQPRTTAVRRASQDSSESEKQLLPAMLLWFFLGFVGAHAFYCGNTKMGVIYLICFFTGFILILPWLAVLVLLVVDLINLVTGKYKDSDGNEVTQWVP